MSAGVKFEFATATRIVFGAGAVRDAAAAARELGSRALLVTGASAGSRDAGLQKSLADGGLFGDAWRVAGEPTIDLVREGARQARSSGCDMVVAFGGGSALDAGKAIAALLTNDSDPLAYVEVIGRGKRLERPSAPTIAIPTTAGTGSEVTRNAVLGSTEHRVKVSMRSPFMLPTLAIVDPELTYDLPKRITASTGLDALTQVIEPYVSIRANPVTDGFCLEGIKRASTALRRAYDHGQDTGARADMSLTSLLSGLALANAGLGAVHGFAAPIGGMFDAPHGAICAALLPHATQVNIEALNARSPGNESLRRYETVARIVTGDPNATPADLVGWLTDLTAALEIPRLRTYGMTPEHFETLVSKAASASSMKANAIVLTSDELHEILRRAL